MIIDQGNLIVIAKTEKNIFLSSGNYTVIDFNISCTIGSEIIESSFLLYKKVTQQYKDQRILESIRELVPNNILREEENNLLAPLLRWFKDEFMRWTPSQIKCANCSDNANPATTNGKEFIMQAKVLRGISWKLRKVEIHTCASCGAVQIFPRYGEVLKVAEERTGRCSEWSILFGAILSSLLLQARIVHDYLDHCWNEVLINGKWIHVDSTLHYPISFNHPHYYEQNWGKKYLYVLAFDANKVVDVTQTYTEQWDSVLLRRRKGSRVQSNGDHHKEGVGGEKDDILPANFQSIYSSIE